MRADNLIYVHNKSSRKNKWVSVAGTSLAALDFRYGILVGVSLSNILVWDMETQAQIVIKTSTRMSDILIAGFKIKDYILIVQMVLSLPSWKIGFLKVT